MPAIAVVVATLRDNRYLFDDGGGGNDGVENRHAPLTISQVSNDARERPSPPPHQPERDPTLTRQPTTWPLGWLDQHRSPSARRPSALPG